MQLFQNSIPVLVSTKEKNNEHTFRLWKFTSQRLVASVLYHRHKRHIFNLKAKWLQWNRLSDLAAYLESLIITGEPVSLLSELTSEIPVSFHFLVLSFNQLFLLAVVDFVAVQHSLWFLIFCLGLFQFIFQLKYIIKYLNISRNR